MKHKAIESCAAFRHELAANPRLRLEFLASISKVLREHQLDIDASLLSVLTVATETEINTGFADVTAGPEAPDTETQHDIPATSSG